MRCPRCDNTLRNTDGAAWLGLDFICHTCTGVNHDFVEGMTRDKIKKVTFRGIKLVPKVERADSLHCAEQTLTNWLADDEWRGYE
jgi:uncharacterized C2H2 Zn-finger protein